MDGERAYDTNELRTQLMMVAGYAKGVEDVLNGQTLPPERLLTAMYCVDSAARLLKRLNCIVTQAVSREQK